MKRRRSGAPGRNHPDGRWPILLLLALAIVAAACGSTAPSSEPESPSAGQGSTAPAPSSDDSTPAPASPAPTESPSSGDPSSETPTEPPGEATDAVGGASECSGSDENRDFFASMAAAVDWTVYCPVLADGWFVEDGHYRLAGGGWMEITYKGPGAAGLVLRQGMFCAESSGCVPPGSEAGDAPFDDRGAQLIAGDDGSWSFVADRGSQPSWLLTVAGLSEADARSIAEDLHTVD